MLIKSLSHFINPLEIVHQHEGIVEPELAKQAEQNPESSLAQQMNDIGNDVNGLARRLLQIGYGKIDLSKLHCEISK